jgi:hypothetical protein
MTHSHLVTELAREASTIVMVVAVAVIAGSKRWERFGYFLVAFGMWDIFYYVWLKVLLNWPQSLGEWDVLFLIPLPWVGPVIAPLLVSVGMIVSGVFIVVRDSATKLFHPTMISWVLSCAATVLLLYSFLSGATAVPDGQIPAAYRYEFLWISLILYGVSFFLACRPGSSSRHA